MQYALLMYADPAHTRAMTEQEDAHVIAVEVRRIHDTA